MTSGKAAASVFIAVLFIAGSLWGADSGQGQKWGLWGDPQPDILGSGGYESPAPEKVRHRRRKADAEAAPQAAPTPKPRAETVVEPFMQTRDTDPADDAEYLVGPGDQLDVSVWKDEALTRTLTVLPEGTVSFPLIGDVAVVGKNVGQIRKEFEDRLAKYIPEPVVSIEVKQVNSRMIYVLGRVNSPGRFALNSNVTVMQALAMAGGCNPFANRNRIKIMRNESDTTKVIHFSYDDVVNDEVMEENITLKRGDVIVVP